jgi:hypothetical protein
LAVALVAMKKAHFLALSGVLLAISWIQPASAAPLQIVNKTDKVALVTVIYHTGFCKDDRGIQVAPNGTFTPKVGLCTVKTVYASITTSPGFALTCIPHDRTGKSTYVVTADSNLKNCYVN